jgi:hypothetical protein
MNRIHLKLNGSYIKPLEMPQLTDAEDVFLSFLLFFFGFIPYFAPCLTKNI